MIVAYGFQLGHGSFKMRFSYQWEFIMKKILFGLFYIVASTTNAQSIYDKCMAAIDAEDSSALIEIATTVKRLKYPGINAKKAEKCLESAFEKDFEFDPSSGMFVDGAEAAERKKQKAENKERQSKIIEISNKLGCHRKKLETIEKLKLAQLQVFIDENNSFIGARTLAACVQLNESDPYKAILNPICRDSFANTLHPDLDVDKGFLDILIDAEGANLDATAKLQAELSKLQMGSGGKKNSSDFQGLIEEALAPCD